MLLVSYMYYSKVITTRLLVTCLHLHVLQQGYVISVLHVLQQGYYNKVISYLLTFTCITARLCY